MKRSTPVIIGLLLILGVVALGYFAESSGSNTTNNSNNSSQFTLFKNPLTPQQAVSSVPAAQSQQSSTTTPTTTNDTTQNTTQNQTNPLTTN
jgi:cytoskeletal protein RodZ